MYKMSSHLELRNANKKKKPTFTQQDNHKKPKLADKWRRPKGSDSKMRVGLRGYKRSPEIGWGSPKDVRGLSRDGYTQNIINTANEIEGLDPKVDGAIIASNVGKKKKIELVKILVEKKINILNLKNPQDYLKSVEKDLSDKKAVKDKKEKEKSDKQKAKEKKAKEKEAEDKKAEKESLADKVSAEEKAEDHKKEETKKKEDIITKG